jgi:hypothetical protein
VHQARVWGDEGDTGGGDRGVNTSQPVPDFGEVRPPGMVGRIFRRRPTIVREANFAAARVGLPMGSSIESIDSRGNWIVFQGPDGKPKIRFRASAAWLAAEPTIMPNDSVRAEAALHVDEKVVVYEGLHRTRATARDKIVIEEAVGGVPSAPGWLDFDLVVERPQPTPSVRAVMQLFGGDPDAPAVPAR